jgi:uncharacterized protein (DUF488 family)
VPPANRAGADTTGDGAGALLTVGHGTALAEQFGQLLRGAGVRALVDVRMAPGSRHNPQMARSALVRWLPEFGVSYRWEPRLGGRRKAPAGSPDTALRIRAFAGYAGHMRSGEFRAAVDDLLAGARQERTAVMCAETLWWRCHRRMVADFVSLVRHVPVLHLGHDGRLEAHVPTDVARQSDDGLLVYDAGQTPLA